MATPILGKSIATAEQMAAYLLKKNPKPKINMSPISFCRLFLYMGALEGVRGDVEFARSCWETNYFKFNGTVVPEQNNYCGHGTVNAENKGSYFPDEATGILVQMQHAKGYATDAPLNYQCLDERYKYVKLGSAPNMEDMGGKWAVPGYDTKKYSSLQAAKDAKESYGDKIVKILNEMLGGTEEKPAADVRPLLGRKICLDPGHVGSNYNKCPSNPTYAESAVMWKLHLLLRRYLEELGATVIVTRSNINQDLALRLRGAKALGCDLFLSLHSNAAGNGMNESIDYVAVYHLVDDASATCDDTSKEIARVIAPAIANVMGVKNGYKILTRKSSNDHNNDGVLNDNYYGVLNGARSVDVPGLILEHSFHTNSVTVAWLLSDANLERLARSEAAAIANYFADKKVEVNEGAKVPYTIRVANVSAGDGLNIRKEPNASAAITGVLAYDDPCRYTIVKEENGWGKLKSGLGWINLKYTVCT